MKRQIWFAALIVLGIPSASFAVKVTDCPQNVSIRLSKLQVISADALKGKLSPQDNDDGLYEALRKSLESVDQIEINGRLDSAAKARCSYSVTSSVSTDKNDELVLASSSGKDWLRLRLNSSSGIIGGFITVSSYSQAGIQAEGDASLGLDDFSHPGFIDPVLARAQSVELK